MERAPKLVDIIAALPEEVRPMLLPRLKAKPVRTASGIAVVAVMSKPHRCPHIATTGNICVYCPGGPDSDFEYSTQSYTGYEPTSMRAIRARCACSISEFRCLFSLSGASFAGPGLRVRQADWPVPPRVLFSVFVWFFCTGCEPTLMRASGVRCAFQLLLLRKPSRLLAALS